MRVTHLNKSGVGFTSMTACGRSLMRTPFSVNWTEFKSDAYKCVKCVNSKQANLNARIDAKKEATAWKHDAPFNPQFLGAQRPQACQDY